MMRSTTSGASRRLAAVIVLACCMAAGYPAGARGSDEPALVPWPKVLKMNRGAVELAGGSRIVAQSADVAPLAGVLADEIHLATGLRLAVATGAPGKGDIGLAIDKSHTNEATRVLVSDRIEVRGGNYAGVGMGTVTVLQSIQSKDGKVTVPRMTVEDQPFAQYTGMMLDIARQFNSIEVLKQCVTVARLYKMKYFHLHMTDDQIFTFPSTKYAAKLKGVYTLAELKDLVKFADERGVTIIPEFEMPGHTSQLAGAFPEVFGDTQGCVINFLNPGAMPILTDLVNEMCDVFTSTPYFHMGSDECNWGLFERWPNVVADREKTGRHTQQQHGWLINEINKVVKQRGKTLIVWEGFDGPDAGVAKDVVVMEWDGRFFGPREVAAAGYKMINVPWVPCIWATARENYEWNMWLLGSQDRVPDQFVRGTPEADLVIGGQMVLWECGGDSALPQLRATAVPRHERIHSPDAGRTYEDFDRRVTHTDGMLDLLVHKFAVKAEGLTNHGDNGFDKALTLTMTPSAACPGGVIRVTLDGSKPGTNSPAYAAPIRIAATTQVNAQLFGADGRPLGFPRLSKYVFRPLSGSAAGLLPEERFRECRYVDSVLATLKSGVGGEIRYTLDGKDPSASSALYGSPVKIEKGAKTLRAAVFVDGKKQGEEWSQSYVWLNYEKNLATGKPAAWGKGLPGPEPTPATEFKTNSPALDGFVEKDKHWGLSPFPCWYKVDLQKRVTLGEIQLYCWWGDDRYYQYTIELSEDDKTWKPVADASQNTEKTTDQGYRHKFAPTKARYIRVTMLKNSANIAVHISEVRAYEEK